LQIWKERLENITDICKEEMDHNETIMDSGHLARSTVFPALVIMIV